MLDRRKRAADRMYIDTKQSGSNIKTFGIEKARKTMMGRITDAILNAQNAEKRNTIITVPDPKDARRQEL